jgi:hypothetical protein
MISQKYVTIFLDKYWLAIISIAVIGMSLDQVTTSYAVTNHTASVESNIFLRHIFSTFPQPFHLLFYALFQTILVLWTIMLLGSSYPKNISYRSALGISSIIAIMPLAAGINNLFFLLS